ncbi:MAG: polysaccharide biosynthesis tyrosine autokinase, partial [Planctomycetes bacterium]|nr:polysaccharide biosynthesis tyrosine autokinase [Planctomycetota bacterium]
PAPGPSTLAVAPLPVTPPAALGAGAVVQALRRRWFLALTVATLSVTAAAGAAWVFLKPACTVRSYLLVASTPPKIAFKTTDNEGEGRNDFASYQKTQAALVKSRLVLTTALRKPQIAELSVVREQPDAIEWLEKELRVDNLPGTELLEISIKGDRPEELTALVNEITKAYIGEIVEKEKNKRADRLKKLQDIYAKAENNLRRTRLTLKEWAETAGSGDDKTLTIKQQFALEQLNTAKKDLMQYASERKRLQAELPKGPDLAKAPRPLSPPDQFVDEMLWKDPTVAHQLQRIALLEEKVEKNKERSALGKDDPILAAPLRELGSLKQALDARRKSLVETLTKQQARRAAEEANAAVARTKERIRVLEELEQGLTIEVGNLSAETRQINKSSLEISSLRDAITKDEVLSHKIADEMEALKVEIEAPSRVTPLEEASVSWVGAEKKRMMGLGAGIFAALALSLFGVTWTELRARRVTRAQDVDQLGVRLVGSIPYLDKHKAQRRLAAVLDMPDPVAEKIMTESIDTVRTMLLHLARVESLRVVMVTSALSGEGKTSVASHLAASLARAGRKTLLIDCDLRKPAAHHSFNLPMGPGFSALLKGTADLGDVIQVTSVEGLSLIPAGLCDAGALRALAQDGARQVFDRLRVEFDFIIVDSSPVLPVVDSLLLAQHTDAVLFSLLRDVSRLPAAQAALKKLEALGVRLLGAVVSGTEHEAGYYNGY